MEPKKKVSSNNQKMSKINSNRIKTFAHDFDNLIKNRNNNCFSENSDSHNIINWYLKWRNKSEKIKNIRHSVSSHSNFKLGNISITNNILC